VRLSQRVAVKQARLRWNRLHADSGRYGVFKRGQTVL